MPQKWNLQDIRRPEPARERTYPTPQRASQDIAPRRPVVEEQPMSREPILDPDLATIDIIDGKATKRKRLIISVLISVVILGAAFGVNLLLGGATVTVYPKFKDVSVQATFTAYAEPKAGELSYELLALDATGERQVTASGQEHVSERAVGKIFIYNTQSVTQRLIKNTRFESPDGLIYRIQESVEVPAATTKDGKVAPGVISTDVFADGTGEQYNVSPSRFTVPGLKGSDQFNAVYGESTEAFTGGFEGDRYIIDDAELEAAKQALHLELRNSLLEKLKTSRPSGFVLYDSAVTFTFESLPSTAYGDSMATIKEKAYLHVPLFKESEYASYIAESTIPGYEDEPVELTDPLTLTYRYESATATVSDISKQSEITFTLGGTTRVVWQFDATMLSTDLVGLSKNGLSNVLSGYPAIERAESDIKPFWAQSFPDTSKEIEIVTVIGDKPE